jgi:3-deoxy-D-manno-oct-2-ulosonic acid (Kdo) hydroxylase
MSAAPSQVLPQDQPEGMSQLVEVQDENANIPALSADPVARGRWCCAQLEAGNILFFSRPPFAIPQDDREFLLGQTQTSSALHKNVAYRPAEDRITGLAKSENVEASRLRLILKNYSQHAAQFLGELLSPYKGKWKLDFASFRPLEERGRSARLHARNDLPHFDSFPTRPTNGDRILRFFTNLNPAQNRVWNTSQTFEAIGPHFAKSIGLPRARSNNPLARGMRGLAGALRLPGAHRSPYDNFMHRCHNAMKEDASFRESCPKQRWEFPPGSSWIVFTDCVSHAVLAGQYALEQTFLISRQAMVEPDRSPIAILERIAGYPLSN